MLIPDTITRNPYVLPINEAEYDHLTGRDIDAMTGEDLECELALLRVRIGNNDSRRRREGMAIYKTLDHERRDWIVEEIAARRRDNYAAKRSPTRTPYNSQPTKTQPTKRGTGVVEL